MCTVHGVQWNTVVFLFHCVVNENWYLNEEFHAQNSVNEYLFLPLRHILKFVNKTQIYFSF